MSCVRIVLRESKRRRNSRDISYAVKITTDARRRITYSGVVREQYGLGALRHFVKSRIGGEGTAGIESIFHHPKGRKISRTLTLLVELG